MFAGSRYRAIGRPYCGFKTGAANPGRQQLGHGSEVLRFEVGDGSRNLERRNVIAGWTMGAWQPLDSVVFRTVAEPEHEHYSDRRRRRSPRVAYGLSHRQHENTRVGPTPFS